ncbi:hypothetical protein SELMODRAFT_404362 [Selaginella moellendorffii]|uniref:Uncharacterized protein n=1 Tax=Selaginella moellendorffii TaxID=88036 RepID=D8QV33_SELML|nr:hypothetical protein SELMODRAFT_404362 [Selaginella moellendorffii]
MGPSSPLPLASSWDVDLSILAEPSARQLQEALGLDEFVAQPLPSLDRSLCDEFLTNFDHQSSSAMVRGERVVIDSTSVSAATGLPIGDLEHDGSEISSTGQSADEGGTLALGTIVLDLKEHTSRGYSVHDLVLGENVEAWKAICEMLMVKLVASLHAGGDAPRAGSIVQARYQDAVGGVPGKDDRPRRENELQEEEHSRRVAHWDYQEQARTARSSSLGRGSQAWAARSRGEGGGSRGRGHGQDGDRRGRPLEHPAQAAARCQRSRRDGGRDREPAKLREEIRLLRGYVERGRAMVASLKEQSKQGAITPQRKKIDQSMDSRPVAAAGKKSFRKEGIAPFDEDVEMENAFPPPLPSSPPPPLPSSPLPNR